MICDFKSFALQFELQVPIPGAFVVVFIGARSVRFQEAIETRMVL